MDLLVGERGMLEDQVEMEVESLVERLNGRARELLFSKVEGKSRKVRVMELLMDWISYGKSIEMKEKS